MNGQLRVVSRRLMLVVWLIRSEQCVDLAVSGQVRGSSGR